MNLKTYVVQKYSRDGKPGEVIDCKLTWGAAHAVAKANAPAKVITIVADKLPILSAPEYVIARAV